MKKKDEVDFLDLDDMGKEPQMKELDFTKQVVVQTQKAPAFQPL